MNPVRRVAKDFGAEPAALVDAQERQRRQGATNALMIIGWDTAASEIMYADGYGCDEDLGVLVTGLTVAMGRNGRTPAEKDRYAAAIREVKSIMGHPAAKEDS